jgi:hypothetical protein
MSLPSPPRSPSSRQARFFLSPLQKKVTIFAVNGRAAHLRLASFLLGCICSTNRTVLVLDTDAIYASNSRTLASQLSETCLEIPTLRVPVHDPTKTSLVTSIFSEYDVLIVDDLNTLYHFLSMDNRSAVRELTAVAKILSYFCRENGNTVFLTAYSPDEALRKEIGFRSILRMGDLSISMSMTGSKLNFRCDRGVAWPDNTFSVNL